MIQLSILKIRGYGPWTLTLGSDREHELQMLQASLYKRLQGLFSEKHCMVFPSRFDEFFAVSNGISLDDHIMIQQTVRESFDVGLSISIGRAETPFGANFNAHDAARNDCLLDRQHNIYGHADDKSPQSVSIMHLDVDDLTSKTKTSSPYDISLMMLKLHAGMSEYFLARDSLTFFMGGDNFMVVASQTAKQSVTEFINTVRDETGMYLNCGIGNAVTARDAVRLATKSLDTIREMRDLGKGKSNIYELSC